MFAEENNSELASNLDLFFSRYNTPFLFGLMIYILILQPSNRFSCSIILLIRKIGFDRFFKCLEFNRCTFVAVSIRSIPDSSVLQRVFTEYQALGIQDVEEEEMFSLPGKTDGKRMCWDAQKVMPGNDEGAVWGKGGGRGSLGGRACVFLGQVLIWRRPGAGLTEKRRWSKALKGRRERLWALWGREWGSGNGLYKGQRSEGRSNRKPRR